MKRALGLLERPIAVLRIERQARGAKARARIVDCLRAGPALTSDLVEHTRLSFNRVGRDIEQMRRDGVVRLIGYVQAAQPHRGGNERKAVWALTTAHREAAP